MAAAGGGTDGGLPLQVILGPCDEMRAEVFVRLARPEASPPAEQLAGEISGPDCRRSITLPAEAPLVDLGAGPSGPLARAVLTEPAFWTPDLPSLYRLTVRIVRDGQPPTEATRRIGLRRSGVRGRSLWLEGRRWVPRGVSCDRRSCAVPAVRDAGLVAVVADPPEPLLVAADEAGLAVIAVAEADAGLPLDADAVAGRIATWAMHPSVVVAALPRSFAEADVATVAAAARRLKGTMVLAREVDGASPPPVGLPAGLDCLLVSLAGGGLPHDAWRDTAPPLPLLARQRMAPAGQADRRSCDQLQATLAAWGLADGRTSQPWDWAGYLVA